MGTFTGSLSLRIIHTVNLPSMLPKFGQLVKCFIRTLSAKHEASYDDRRPASLNDTIFLKNRNSKEHD